MKIIVFSCSLQPLSRSRVLARQAVEDLESLGVDAQMFDLRDYDLEFCGSPSAREAPEVEALKQAVEGAGAVLVAAPIYNFDVNAAAKNLVELTGRSWTDKLVGFMCAAGGRASYMSVMGIANSLMLDFRCLIVPRFVYATGDAFGDDRTETMYIDSDEIKERLSELVEMTVRLAGAIEQPL